MPSSSPRRMPSLSVSWSCGLAYSASRSSSGLPQRGVAHDHGIDHAKFVEGKLVLPQNAELLRAGNVTLGRFEFAGQNLHQRGFACTIGTGDTIAALGKKRAGHILKEDPAAEAHSDIVDGKHGPFIVPNSWRFRSRSKRAVKIQLRGSTNPSCYRTHHNDGFEEPPDGDDRGVAAVGFGIDRFSILLQGQSSAFLDRVRNPRRRDFMFVVELRAIRPSPLGAPLSDTPDNQILQGLPPTPLFSCKCGRD